MRRSTSAGVALSWRGGIALAACLLVAWVAASSAQDEESSAGGQFLENVIVGRPLALRLRGEVQFTDDDDVLLDQDVSYARFPSRMYYGEAKLFQADRSLYSAAYSLWENPQGLENRQSSWKIWVPLPSGQSRNEYHLTVKFRDQRGDEGTLERQYWYAAVDRSAPGGLYSYLQYRYTAQEGRTYGHELYEYLSWKLTSRLRVGEQGSVTKNADDSQLGSRYLSLFGTMFVLPDRTALRGEVRYYDSGEDLDYWRYNLYLYHRVGAGSLVRLSYRLYDDSEGLSSQAYGVKLARYFSPGVSAHVGYRYYDHSEGLDFNTFYGGFEILL